MLLSRQRNSNSSGSYKVKYSLEERIKQSEAIIAKHINYIPVIVECDPAIGVMRKQKFLVPQDVNCSHIIVAIRNQLKIDNSKSVFIFFNDTIICPTENVKQVYYKYLSTQNDGDKFFHIYVTTENTFG
jgi:hypothetical protein